MGSSCEWMSGRGVNRDWTHHCVGGCMSERANAANWGTSGGQTGDMSE